MRQEEIRDEVQYEQCLWNKTHVRLLYPRLNGVVVADDEWHEFPPVPTSFGYYRVYQDRFFQALFSEKSHASLTKYQALNPAEVGHDAEWTLWQDNEDDPESGFVITSKFAVTPGPFP